MATVAKQQYHGDDKSIVKNDRIMEVEPGIIEKISTIQEGAEKNKIQYIKVNGQTVPISENREVDITVPHVIDDVYSDSDTDALSANMGRMLSEEITHLKGIGRFLSLWSSALGIPTTQPPQGIYKYKTGDYYIITNVAGEGGTNYKPEGDQYMQGDRSETIETEKVKEGDTYFYDGAQWTLQINTVQEITVDDTLSLTSENPVQNKVITAKVNEINQAIPTLVSQLDNDTGFITEEAIPDISVKLDKVNTANQVYGTDNNGEQKTYEIASGVKSNTVVLRGNNGVVGVGTPTANNHATTKKYVDDAIANIEIDVDDTLSTTSTNPVQNKVITERINELELLKTPNATVVGEPSIVAGNISDFSSENYLIVPFLSSFVKTPFIIHMDITTGDEVNTQQNIIDSDKGLAFAIRNGRFVIALSTDGISWIGEYVGTKLVSINTDYHIEIEWTGTNVLLRYSTDGTTYTTDIATELSTALSGKPLYLGGYGTTSHSYKGTFNFNEWYFVSNGNVVWRGMDSAGLDTRANVSLNNLDEEGEAKFNAKQDVIEDLQDIRDGASKGYTALQPNASADELIEGTNHLFLTSSEREKLGNTEGINTGDETQATIKTKLGSAGTTSDGYLTKEDYYKFNNKQAYIEDLETIRDGASKGATALQTETDPLFTASPAYSITNDDKTKWTNKQDSIEDLEAIRTGANLGASAIQEETDPIFVASPAHSITDENIAYWNEKQQLIEDLSEIREGARLGSTALQEFTETDPVFKASPASGIKTTDINNWNAKQGAIEDLETIRDGASKGATALQSESDPVFKASPAGGIKTTDISNWNAKQNAITDLQDIRSGAAKGKTAIQEETDPVFTSSPAGGITDDDISNWNAKQNYIEDLETIRAGAAKGATALQSFTETDPVFKASAASGIKQTDINNWNNKQATISDLETIRSGAALGMTALQEFTETDPLYTADKPTIALKSEIPDISGKLDKTQIASATQDGVLSKEDFATFSAKQNAITDLDTIRDGASKGATAVQPAVLNSFATLLDLSNGLKEKQDKALVTTLTNPDDTHYPSAKAVADAMSSAGFGDMLKSTYDPNNVGKNAFDYNNFINTPTIVDNVTTDSSTSVLSAKQGKLLQDQIDTLEARGHFLSNWNATTGQPVSFPLKTPYTYTTGDYFIVTVVGTNNKKPSGTSYNGTASTVAESEELATGDVYTYDGTTRLLQVNHGKTVSFANLSGEPSDNVNLANALNNKQPLITDLETIRNNASAGATAKTTVDTHVANATIHVTASDKVAWSKKQEAITDLETIRSGASLGATALQPGITSDDIAEGTTNLYFTSAEKTKLGNITGTNTGDETASTIKTKLGITTLSGSNTGDETTNTIKNKLGVASTSSDGYLQASDYVKFNGKQDSISDLDEIRSGAELGATALQEETDPVFTASVAHSITQDNINSWNAKQDALPEGIANRYLKYTSDGITWSTIPDSSNVKYFVITGAYDGTNAKKVLNWCLEGKYAIVRNGYGNKHLFFFEPISSIPSSEFIGYSEGVVSTEDSNYTKILNRRILRIFLSGGNVSYISEEWDGNYQTYLSTKQTDDGSKYTPTQGGQPTNKKYVDDQLANKQGTIDDLDAIRSGAALGAAALQEETDPTVPSHVKAITEQNITDWTNKQNTITDLETIRSKANSALQTETDPIFTASASYGITSTDIENWNAKQGVISDLATIRDGASKGATAYQLPNGGIPSTDLSSAIQTQLTKLSTTGNVITHNDNEYVHKLGEEAINGYKKFTGGQSGSGAKPSIQAKNGLMVGGYDVTGWSDVSVHRVINNTIQTGSYFVDGTGALFFRHKSGTSAAEGSNNDAVFQVNYNGIKAAFSGTPNQAVGETHDVLIDTVQYSSLNTTAKDVLGAINEVNSSIVPTGGTEGQVLTKTATGAEWQDSQGGGAGMDVLLQDTYDNLSEAEKMDGTFRFIYIEEED